MEETKTQTQQNNESSINDYSIIGWIDANKIVNEKGDPITFHNHMFLVDIYEEMSQYLVVMKAAQIGLSTLEILKNFYDAARYKMDIIYTLPTDSDVNIFVSGKVNRIIVNNPILQTYTKDKDSVEQKHIKKSVAYFRGTWTEKAANMVTADRLVHDEKDASNQSVISMYQARLQHSKYKHIHTFSHPSSPGVGVHADWQESDQKEWFITCPHCQKEQYLSWNTEDDSKMSVDFERREFICKKCKGVLSWKDRAVGRWVAKYKTLPGGKPVKFSGYHISLLMAPWVTAGEIIDKFNDPKSDMEFFYTRVLGLPYAGSGNSVAEETIKGLVTSENNSYDSRLIMGVDTGIALRYVIGNAQGLVEYGEKKDYMPDENNGLGLQETLEYYLKAHPQLIMVIDQGGDIIGSRKLREKYPGRVFLCHYITDRKTLDLIKWGKKDEDGVVHADRNRMIQMVIDEARERRFKLYNGTREDWHNYWLHWSHIYRKRDEDKRTEKPVYRWHRSDRDDWVHATVYWRIGLSRFGGKGAVIMPRDNAEPNSYLIEADNTVTFSPEEMFKRAVTLSTEEVDNLDDDDWR